MEMDEALDQWLKNVQQVANLPVKEQEKITSEGAKAFESKIKQATKAQHPDRRGSGGKYGHLSANIESKKGDTDGVHNGTSNVGFRDKDFVARFLNDGTFKMSGSHFVDNARRDYQNDVLRAELTAYQKYLKKMEAKLK